MRPPAASVEWRWGLWRAREAIVLCSHCHGKRSVVCDGAVFPCPECGGLGEVHCCDGLQAQPEPADGPAEGEAPPAEAAP